MRHRENMRPVPSSVHRIVVETSAGSSLHFSASTRRTLRIKKKNSCWRGVPSVLFLEHCRWFTALKTSLQNTRSIKSEQKASKAWRDGVKEQNTCTVSPCGRGGGGSKPQPKEKELHQCQHCGKARLLQQAAGRNVSMLKLFPSTQCLLCLYLMWQYQTGSHVFFILLSMISKKKKWKN